MSGVDAANPSLQQGAGYLASSTSPTGIDMASPFLTKAGQTSVTGIQDYMNPYTDLVVNRIAELGNRNFNEKLIPQISDQFVGAGGYGGSRQAEAIGRAARDTQEGISAEQARALEAAAGRAADVVCGPRPSGAAGEDSGSAWHGSAGGSARSRDGHSWDRPDLEVSPPTSSTSRVWKQRRACRR